MQNPTKYIFCTALLGALALATPVHASLLGSTIFLSHRFPTSQNSDTVQFYPVTVASGTSDSNIFGNIYTSNPESDRILINFFRPFVFDPDQFNGHVGEFIPEHINNISIDTNLQGWDSSRLTYTSNSFYFNWSGLEVEPNSYFYAQLNFQNSVAPVPEPSTALLFGAGMGLFYFPFRRKTALPS